MKLSYYIVAIALLGIHLYAQDVDTKALYDTAHKAYAKGEFAAAYPLFEQLFEQTPDSAEINFFVGRCALELRHYDEAIAAFDRVLMLKGGDWFIIMA